MNRSRRDRDNVPRWLNRLVVFITAVLATIVVLAGASIVRADDTIDRPETSDCVGPDGYCDPVPTTEPPAPTTEPAATTAPPAPTTEPALTTEPAATTAPPAPTTEPAATTAPPAPTTEPTVSVVPPPVPSTDPEPCPVDPQGRELRSDCTPDPCVVRTGPNDTYSSTNYTRGHVAGGDHGTTTSFVIDCTVPTTTPPPSQTLPNTGGNGAAMSIVALGLLATGTALVAASRRRPA